MEFMKTEVLFGYKNKYNNLKITNLKFLLVLVALFLTSCNSNNEGMSYNKLGALDKGCEYPLNVGEDITDFTFSKDAIERGPFGNKYNKDFLEKILQSSAQATLKFAHSLGIKTMRVEQSQSNCQLFSFLEEARGENLELWMNVVEQNGRPPGGLFSSINSSTSSVPVNPVIFLKIDSNRWTLVHELMHYNFHRTSIETYGFWELDKLENDYTLKRQALDVNLKGYLEHKDLENFEILVESVTSVMSILNDYLLRGRSTPIQEVSIEYILIKSYLEGELTYVPNGTWGAYSYMSGNAKLLLDTFVYPIKNIIDQHLIETSKIYWEYRDQVHSLSEEINRYPVTFENALKQVEESIRSGEWVEE